MTKIYSLLSKLDYITTVKHVEGGCLVTYPHPKLLSKTPRLTEEFIFQKGEKPGIWAKVSREKAKKFIDLPRYATFLYILYEIMACNAALDVEQSLILFFNEAGEIEDDFHSCFDMDLSPEDTNKEAKLCKVFLEAKAKEFDKKYEEIAKSNGVAEGYDVIRKFYQ